MNYETTNEAKKAIAAELGNALTPNIKLSVNRKSIMGETRYFVNLTITDPELFTKPMNACTSSVFDKQTLDKYGEAINKVCKWKNTVPRNTINGTNIL